MKIIKNILILILIVLVAACKPDHVFYTIEEHSDYFRESYIKINNDEKLRELQIELDFPRQNDFKFPIINAKDTLSWTQFNFDLNCQGKPIIMDSTITYNDLWKILRSRKSMYFAGPIRNIMVNNYQMKFAIPHYAFHSLKSGLQKITLKVYQDYFFGKIEDKNDSSNYQLIKQKQSSFWATINLTIQIPVIEKTRISLVDFEIINSKGMDFSLINQGNADLLWRIAYPNPENQYFKSNYIKNTMIYDIKDTIMLYHYDYSDKITLSVVDFDWLSKDDLIESWTSPIADLLNKGQKENYTFTSDKLKSFRLMAERMGTCNK